MVLIVDPKSELKSFRVATSTPMGSKRGRGRGALIDSVLDVVDDFYGDVMQHLKAWSSAPPKMREPDIERSEPTALSSVALSSQDGAEQVSERQDVEADVGSA